MSRWDHFRDTLVSRLCNFLIVWVASEQYSSKLTLVIAHGMSEAEAGNIPGLQKKDRHV